MPVLLEVLIGDLIVVFHHLAWLAPVKITRPVSSNKDKREVFRYNNATLLWKIDLTFLHQAIVQAAMQGGADVYSSW